MYSIAQLGEIATLITESSAKITIRNKIFIMLNAVCLVFNYSPPLAYILQ